MDRNYHEQLRLDIRKERGSLLGVIGGLVFIVLLLVMKLLTTHERIVLQAPFQNHPQYEIGWERVSEDYAKEWGLYVATLVGNVSPESAEFTAEALSRIVAPDLRNEVRQKVLAEARTMKDEGYSLTFYPERIEYNRESQLVVVRGEQVETTINGDTRRGMARFEMIVGVHMGQPRIEHYALTNDVSEGV